MLYLMNTLIVPVDFDKHKDVTIELRRISVEEARKLVKSKRFVSAVGHESTAKMLSILLEVDVPVQRTAVFFEPGDEGLHFFLKERLPEGKILDYDELVKMDFWLVRSEVK